MRPASEIFTFSSVSGSTFAFFFFLCFALLIGLAVYALFRHPAAEAFGGTAAGRRAALLAGAGVALLIFLGVYFGSLGGFYRLEVQGDEFRLVYILPRRIRILPRADIGAVTAEPTYKALWRLAIRTRSGDEFTSARSDQGRVRAAQERLVSLLAPK